MPPAAHPLPKGVSPDQLAELQRQELAEFVPIIEDLKARSDGPISEMDPLTVLGVMGGSIGVLMLHKDEYEGYEGELDGIDKGYYEHVQDVLIETLARGLTVE